MARQTGIGFGGLVYWNDRMTTSQPSISQLLECLVLGRYHATDYERLQDFY